MLELMDGVDGVLGKRFDWVLKVSGCTVLQNWVSDKEMSNKTRLWIISRSTAKSSILTLAQTQGSKSKKVLL